MSWRDDSPKSVAGLTRGTAGPITGTVTALTQENCRELSLSRDREAHLDAVICPTTGTHIIYQMGSAVEVKRDDADAGDGSLLGGRHHAS